MRSGAQDLLPVQWESYVVVSIYGPVQCKKYYLNVRAAVSKAHEPRLDSFRFPSERSNACTQGKTFECFCIIAVSY
jgi:hypothetical protein